MYRDFLKVLDKSESNLSLTGRGEESGERRCARTIGAGFSCHEGRMAFFKGDTRAALQRIAVANGYYKSGKLSAVIVGLRLFPRILLATYKKFRTFACSARTLGPDCWRLICR